MNGEAPVQLLALKSAASEDGIADALDVEVDIWTSPTGSPPAAIILLLTLSAVNLSAQESRKLIAHPAPVYPEMARNFAPTGTVKVQVVTATDGHIKETKFIGGHPILVAAVEDTLKKWKYAAASGESTDVLEFNFHP